MTYAEEMTELMKQTPYTIALESGESFLWMTRYTYGIYFEGTLLYNGMTHNVATVIAEKMNSAYRVGSMNTYYRLKSENEELNG